MGLARNTLGIGTGAAMRHSVSTYQPDAQQHQQHQQQQPQQQQQQQQQQIQRPVPGGNSGRTHAWGNTGIRINPTLIPPHVVPLVAPPGPPLPPLPLDQVECVVCRKRWPLNSPGYKPRRSGPKCVGCVGRENTVFVQCCMCGVKARRGEAPYFNDDGLIFCYECLIRTPLNRGFNPLADAGGTLASVAFY